MAPAVSRRRHRRGQERQQSQMECGISVATWRPGNGGLEIDAAEGERGWQQCKQCKYRNRGQTSNWWNVTCRSLARHRCGFACTRVAFATAMWSPKTASFLACP